MLAVVGRSTFACTFEEHIDRPTDCLLSNDATANETWEVVDGNGFVADNTMNNGQ